MADFSDLRRMASKAAGAGADWFEQRGLVVPLPGQQAPPPAPGGGRPPLGPGGIPIMYGLAPDYGAFQPRPLMGAPAQNRQMSGADLSAPWAQAMQKIGGY